MTATEQASFAIEELQLAARNHALPLEALEHEITPLGLHYLLIHFDIPNLDPAVWRLDVAGEVDRPLSLTLNEVMARPARTLAVTFECAGNGRAHLSPRSLSQPWLLEAVGTAEWTGTPLRPLLEEAGLGKSSRHVVFTGHDTGIQGDVRHAYERSLPLEDALADEVLVAWAINGQPLTPQHGYPLRLVVPGWYGMTNVKWLRSIAVAREETQGWQQQSAYRLHTTEEDPGTPVTRMLPRSLLVPPGIPDFFSRTRHLAPGPCRLTGRAWSGQAPITGVEVSSDGGTSWNEAELGAHVSPFAWCGWSYDWDARPGEHELCCRAADAAGNVQPLAPEWNLGGYCNNAVHRVQVVVA